MKITVLKGCRSDSGLIAPILKRLKEDWKSGFFGIIDKVKLVPSDYHTSYAKMDWYLKHNTPDLVIIPGDRIEMMAGATCCFLFGIPIAHIYGGVTNYPLSTVDDTFRHCISMMSKFVFCENHQAYRTVTNLLMEISREYSVIIKEIGNLYMCDYEIEESTVDVPFCLVLYNGYKGSDNLGDRQEIKKNITTKRVVVISGNPDSKFTPKFNLHHNVTYNENLPHPIFLGLLKNCERFITNSSAAYYEAPTFLKPEQIILIGDRNKARSSLNLPEGKPDVVIETIKSWWRKR